MLSYSQSTESQVQGLSRISDGMLGYKIQFLQSHERLNDVRLERSEMTCCGRLFQTVAAA